MTRKEGIYGEKWLIGSVTSCQQLLWWKQPVSDLLGCQCKLMHGLFCVYKSLCTLEICMKDLSLMNRVNMFLTTHCPIFTGASIHIIQWRARNLPSDVPFATHNKQSSTTTTHNASKTSRTTTSMSIPGREDDDDDVTQ